MTVDISCGSARADRNGLIMALRNLLDNALKFSVAAPHPEIGIGAREEANRCILWVKETASVST